MPKLNDLVWLNFSSRIFRSVLQYFFREGRFYKLPFGPIRGMKLLYDRKITFHAILGLLDLHEYTFMKRILQSDLVPKENTLVLDAGANQGYFSFVATKSLQKFNHEIVAVEASSGTVERLTANVKVNDAQKVKVIHAACYSANEELDFFETDNIHTASIFNDASLTLSPSAPKKTKVQGLRMDDYFLKNYRRFPHFIKMDIEGAGIYALDGCQRMISEMRPLIWFESHNHDEDRKVSALVLQHDYQAYSLQKKAFLKNRDRIHPDPDGIQGHMLLVPSEKISMFLRVI